MNVQLNAKKRAAAAGSELRKLRKQGRVPGIVYGKQLRGGTLIAVEEKELLQLLRGGANGIIDLSIEEQEGAFPVMLQELQRDRVQGNILHVDFRQIVLSEPVVGRVRLDFIGEPKGVADEGGILQVQTREIEVRCLPADLPAALSVDISGLAAGDTLVAGELALPGRIALQTEPEELIATVLLPQKAEAEDEAEQLDNREKTTEAANEAEQATTP